MPLIQVRDQLNFDRDEEMAKCRAIVDELNPRQLQVFEEIDSAISTRSGQCYYLTGSGGTGKTHVTKVCTNGVMLYVMIVVTKPTKPS